MNSHTKGPWHYDEVWSLITGPEGPEQQICAIHGSESVPRKQAQANARLIAAAPNLLAACQAIADCNTPTQVIGLLAAAQSALSRLDDNKIFPADCLQLRAAIYNAKAKG